MRELLLGALGASLAYAVIWYQMAPPDVVVAAAPSPRPAGSQGSSAARPPAAARAPRPVADGVVKDGAGEPAAFFYGTQSPTEAQAARSHSFLEPLPTALPKTIERMAELQRVSGDPQALADRVQGMESDEAELAALKAFAERFVALPPDRVQRHVPDSSRPPAASAPAVGR